ncbi:MAG: leucine zipper domain-containing protein [bacterium]|nr:leucine zipper domain-containing protein [bacterium]
MAQIRRHRDAKLAAAARRAVAGLMLEGGWSVAAAAERFQVGAKTARKWRGRYLAEGEAGLLDRSSRPHGSPARTPPEVRAGVIELRARRRRGAAWIASEVALAPSTVQDILNEVGLGHLDRGDRATAGAQRYVRETPGELIHTAPRA